MTECKRHSNHDGTPPTKGIFGWFLFPISLFPFVALMTYDWRAIDTLQSPPVPSPNWIGSLGDAFAYYGYQLFGLAIWMVPVVCVIAGLCLVAGRKMRPGRREAWFAVSLLATSSLVQALQHHAPGLKAMAERINFANAGGAIGYLAMDKLLSPLLSDFGASVVLIIALAISLVGAIGLHNLVNVVMALCRWVAAPGQGPISEKFPASRKRTDDGQGGDNADDDWSPKQPARGETTKEEPAKPENGLLAMIKAAAAAREAAHRQRETERARIKAEKQQARDAKERAKQEAEQRAKAGAAAAETAAKAREPLPQGAEPSPDPVTISPSSHPAARPSAARPADEAPPDKGPYMLPPINLLNPIPQSTADHGDVDEMSKRLVDTLMLFNVEARLDYTIKGPVVTKYAVELKPGTKYSAVSNISDNLMGALHAKSLRIETPIPGQDRVGIEVPNKAAVGISFREIIESPAWKDNVWPRGDKPAKYQLPLLFGKDAAGNDLVADLATMPHMLVAGATGQGKSVCLNAIINGLLMSRTPQELKFIMVDPKSVEFTAYAAIPHLIVPVITDNKKVVFSLQWAVVEMEKRLKMFARARCRNIMDFNHRKTLTQTDMFGEDSEAGSDLPRTVPYIVIIIDEVADLMATSAKEVVPNISRLAAKARAAGIHLILATQRPDAKVITGTIKANIPGRVAFKTATAVDSRTILDDGGAENLIGRGDMLYKTKESLLIRAQGAWISDPEIDRITEFISQHANTDFDAKFAKKLGTIKEAEKDIFDDDEGGDVKETPPSAAEQRATVKAAEDADLYKRALECIINTQRASTSHFQRRLGIGYNHAARLCDMLEEKGVIGPQRGAGPREILLSQEQLLGIFNGGEAASDATAERPGDQAADEPEAGTPDDGDVPVTEEEQQ